MKVLNVTLNKKHALLAVLALTSGAAMATGVVTGTTAGAFDDILDEAKGLLVGAPGKIVAIFAFGLAIANVVKQNFIAAMGAFVGALLTAFAGSVIDTIFSAGI